MGFFNKKPRKVTPMERIRHIEKMRKGWLTNVILPEVESVSHGMVTKGVATAAFGLVGLVMTMGSSTHQRKIRTTIRIPEKGIVIEKGTIDGKDIKLPWDVIINAHNAGPNIYIDLKEGETINFTSYAIIRHVNSTANFITSYINECASGQVEEGWGGPMVIEAKDTPPKPAPAVGPNFCSNCGSPLEAGGRFCGNCGQPTD